MAKVNLTGFGYNESVDKTGNYTATAADSGRVLNFTASAVLTLPAVGATFSNVTVIARVGAEGITLEIAPNSADKIVGNGLTAADDKSIYFTSQDAGSFVVLKCTNEATTDSAWVIERIVGDITREA